MVGDGDGDKEEGNNQGGNKEDGDTDDSDDDDDDDENKDNDADPTDDFSNTLSLIFHQKFMSLSTPLPRACGAPTSPLLTFTLAELFGPLPTPSCLYPPSTAIPTPPALLAQMPPHLRPHAGARITFDLPTVAGLLLQDMDAIRPERAAARAGGVVDAVYRGVWEGMERVRVGGVERERREGGERERGERRRRREEGKDQEEGEVQAEVQAGGRKRKGKILQGKKGGDEGEAGDAEGELRGVHPPIARRRKGQGKGRGAAALTRSGVGRGGRAARVRVAGASAKTVATTQ